MRTKALKTSLIRSTIRVMCVTMLPLMGVSVGAGMLAGCGGDVAPLFMEISWRARRPNLLSATDHNILGLTGAEGRDLSCNVGDSEGRAVLEMDAFDTPSFGIQLRGVVFDRAGGPAQGVGCQTTVLEGNNTYRDACGNAEPTEAQPCRAYDLSISMTEPEGPTVFGKLRCNQLENRSDNSLKIDLTGPGEGMEAAATPVSFRLVNCNGLVED